MLCRTRVTVNITDTFFTVGHRYKSGQSSIGRFPINTQRFWDSRSQTGFSALFPSWEVGRPGQKVEFPVVVLRLPFMFFI